jgi:hypothetical protein
MHCAAFSLDPRPRVRVVQNCVCRARERSQQNIPSYDATKHSGCGFGAVSVSGSKSWLHRWFSGSRTHDEQYFGLTDESPSTTSAREPGICSHDTELPSARICAYDTLTGPSPLLACATRPRPLPSRISCAQVHATHLCNLMRRAA